MSVRSSFESGTRLICQNRASWMTDDQWQQLQDFVDRKQVPTDPEIVAGLAGPIDRTHSRFSEWAWYNISSTVLGPVCYKEWADCIRGHVDPDMQVDEGL